jgi:hypothetical protein
MKKQMFVFPALIILVLAYNLYTLPIQTNALSVLAAGAIYGLTGSAALSLFALVATAVIVFAMPVTKKKEGFHNDGAKEISERLKVLKPSEGKSKVTGSTAPMGVLEHPSIESFLSVRAMRAMDASGAEGFIAPFDASGVEGFVDATTNAGAPSVSVPALVRDKGRMLVVPESQIPSTNTSVDRTPKANPVINDHDHEGVKTALA